MSIEEKFNKAMEQIYLKGVECGYDNTQYLNLLKKKGGVAAAKHLIVKPRVALNYMKLWDGTLDYSFEGLVVQREFRELFTDEEVESCKITLEARFGLECKRQESILELIEGKYAEYSHKLSLEENHDSVNLSLLEAKNFVQWCRDDYEAYRDSASKLIDRRIIVL